MPAPAEPSVVIVMGVSGVGKTTVAHGIADAVGWEFAEGDAFHPADNVAKMHSGEPLTDADRWPWLGSIRDFMAEAIAGDRSVVLTCSALKVAYRDILREAGRGVRFLHLVAGEDLIDDRITARTGHFMPPSLLQSQFDALEPLTAAELAGGSVVVSVDGPPEAVLGRCLVALELSLG